MEMQELEITIPRDGTIQVAVKGIKGTGCLSVTKGLEQAAGDVIDRTFSAAYYEQPVSEESRLNAREDHLNQIH